MNRRQIPAPRAREVMVLHLAGHHRYRIAHELGISPATVRTYMGRLRVGGWLPRRRWSYR